MPYAFDLTYTDYKAAQALHLRHDRLARRWFFFWQRLMPVVALIAAVILIRDAGFGRFLLPAWLAGLLGGLIWLGIYPVIARPLLLKRNFRRLRPELTGDVHPVELDFIEGRIVSRVPGRSEGRFERGAVAGFAEDEKIALIYISKRTFLYIPKNALPEEGWRELHAWLGPH